MGVYIGPYVGGQNITQTTPTLEPDSVCCVYMSTIQENGAIVSCDHTEGVTSFHE